MCGIAGWIGGNSNQHAVERMLGQMYHRGPDGHGLLKIDLHSGEKAVLGHRRLAILDLSDKGRQPMTEGNGHEGNGPNHITFNGEIYNYIELRNELKSLGCIFSTDTDTEVILKGYGVWGADVVKKLNGMFAFCLVDEGKQKAILARDRYGEKPLLYWNEGGEFIFASEFKALLQITEIQIDLDEERLFEGLYNPSHGIDADECTVFRKVKQLKPGQLIELCLKSKVTSKHSYYLPNVSSRNLTYDSAVEEFRELLIDSVRIRMRSDVAVGSCLSGGLDSSSIVSIAVNVLGVKKYHTFTGSFPGSDVDEMKYAKILIDQGRIIPHVVVPSVERFLAKHEDFVWFNELPVGSSSQFAQFSVFELAKEQGVTVLLDGQGADEQLGGYEQYFQNYLSSILQECEPSFAKLEERRIRERYPLALPTKRRKARGSVPFLLRYGFARATRTGNNFLYGARYGTAKRLREKLEKQKLSHASLSEALTADTFGRFLTTLLRYGDRNSMAHSREVRLPFCDHRIADFVLGLPPSYLMGNVQTKRLLRDAMKGILPEGIRTRWNKQGFRPPQSSWFSNKMFRNQCRDLLYSRHFADSPFWNHKWWRKRLEAYDATKNESFSWQLWAPVMATSWRINFLEKVKSQRNG